MQKYLTLLLTFHIRLVQSTMSQRMNGKDYGQSILAWYGHISHVTNNETAKTMVGPYKASMINHDMNNEWQKLQ